MSQRPVTASPGLADHDPPMPSTPRFLIALIASFSLLLAACGGDDGGDTTADAPATDTGSEDAGDDDMAEDAGDEMTEAAEDEMAEEATSEPVRPTREELCDIIFGNAVQLTAYAGIMEYVDEPGAVLGSDCAIESTVIGYVSLSLIPALEPDLATAAEGFDGTIVTTPASDSIILIEDPTGIAHTALIDEGGVIYRLQIASDAATTSIDAVVEAAISTQASIRNR